MAIFVSQLEFLISDDSSESSKLIPLGSRSEQLSLQCVELSALELHHVNWKFGERNDDFLDEFSGSWIKTIDRITSSGFFDDHGGLFEVVHCRFLGWLCSHIIGNF